MIGGPGAFVVPIDDFKSFDEAMIRKLISEIAAAPSRGVEGEALARLGRVRPGDAAPASRLVSAASSLRPGEAQPEGGGEKRGELGRITARQPARLQP